MFLPISSLHAPASVFHGARRCLSALPLVLILPLSPIQAATINALGTPGGDGALGVPGQSGQAGGAATALNTSPDATNTTSAAGGYGGAGGAGIGAGVSGGAGGQGGDATARAETVSTAATSNSSTMAMGGGGGNTGAFGGYSDSLGAGASGGNGGNAVAETILTGQGNLTGTAMALGGSGGGDVGSGIDGGTGRGGTATASVQATLNGDAARVNLSATATGGAAGGAAGPFGPVGPGGDGTDVTLTNAVGLTTAGHAVDKITLSQSAIGGAGGEGSTSGQGGDALSTLITSDQAVTDSSMYVTATGGESRLFGSYNNYAGQGRGGDAEARADLTTTALTGYAQANAVGGQGNVANQFGYSPFGTGGGNAKADAHLTLTTPGATGLAVADARSGLNFGNPGPDAADAHARIDGAGSAFASSQSRDFLGDVSANATSGREASSHSGFQGTVTPGTYSIEADHIRAVAERSPTLGAGNFGYGMFSSGYGGNGEAKTYEGRSAFSFYGLVSGSYNLAGAPVYLDLLSFKSIGDGFDSLSLDIRWAGLMNDGSTVFTSLTQTFTDLMGFQTFFDSDPFLVDQLIEFSIGYSYTAHTVGSGFAFDYRLAQSPTTPLPPTVPLPASLAFLASALAGLGLLHRSKGRG